MKAIWNNKIIAETAETLIIENNHYFPENAIKKEYFKKSTTHTQCPWKGEASYYTVEVDGLQNKDAAWYYPEPKDAAKAIKNHVAFWKGVEVKE
ncbi:DUF427 domain-containing protein [Aequorivita lipolytica]|jgi:uncharacterized protein (DUF427 family)|nr:DUF427 domain-containing protein [Aequorivita lipolytica]SRX50170.1 hypothetical protein AEQU2_00639 [Aequorivita lipolytica]